VVTCSGRQSLYTYANEVGILAVVIDPFQMSADEGEIEELFPAK
jgi:hypothetical protein